MPTVSAPLHTCRYSRETTCRACEAEREAGHLAQRYQADAEAFLRAEAHRLPPEVAEQPASPAVLYLLGAAIAHGRTQERANGQAPPGGTPDPIARFGRLDFTT